MIIDVEKLNTIHCLDSNESMSKMSILADIHKRKMELRANGFSKHKCAILLRGNSLRFFIDLLAVWDMQGHCLVINENVNKKVFVQLFDRFAIDLVIDKKGNSNRNSPGEGKIIFRAPLMLASSGTSGRPKIIELSAARIQDRIKNIQKMIGPQVSRGLLFLSTSFGHGLIANGLSLLDSSRELFVSHEFDVNVATGLRDLIENNSIDFFSSVPSHFEALDKITKGQFVSNTATEIHCASSPLPKSTFRKALGMFPNSQFKYHYGMTEMGSWITQKELGRSHETHIPNDVGIPYGLSLKINPSDSHIYIKNEIDELVAYDIFKNETVRVSQGQYFDTQDVGRIENEKICLDGRHGDFINKAGNKISALEVESAIEEICNNRKYMVVPAVSEFYGEEVAVVFFECPPNEKLQEDIQILCLKNLGSLKVPKHFFYLPEVPIASNGKVSRVQVSSLIERQIKKV